jgi:hypothetical protein
MPQETIKEADEGGLIRLKYTFKFGDKFVEPDDDWLKSIENLSDELLGAYSKAEDTALSAAFGGRKKKRLNRVFDAIGFVYPDYRYLIRGQKRKGTTSAKEEAATAPSEPAPERKRIKVLTHRPRYIEPASVPEFTGDTSSATEAEKPTKPTSLPKVAEMTEMPTRTELEEPKILLPETKEMAEAPSSEKMEEAKGSAEGSKISEVLSPSADVETTKTQKGQTVTPKRKRMVNVLDVLETIKSSSTTPKKTVSTSEAKTEISETKASEPETEAEAGPSEATKVKSLETEEEKITEPIFEEISAVAPEASPKVLDYIVRHASGKNYQNKKSKRPSSTPKN